MNSTIIMDNIISAKAHIGYMAECAKSLGNKYVFKHVTECIIFTMKYIHSGVYKIQPKLLCGTNPNSEDKLFESANTTLTMQSGEYMPADIVKTLPECELHDIFAYTNNTASCNMITNTSFCFTKCKISNCINYLTEISEKLFANNVDSNENTVGLQDSKENSYIHSLLARVGVVEIFGFCVITAMVLIVRLAYKTKLEINNLDIKKGDSVVELSNVEVQTIDNNTHEHIYACIDEHIYAHANEHIYETIQPKGEIMIQTAEVIEVI
ncbi:hypothetical protein OTSKATO_1416 [Orientia tsutsugamushi str. Kato PP]|uniref:Uncharacterized protein n=3 Tax=Orientia tsutsugamushi TaxID=784 RepID=A0A2U3R2K4_ORITS|nr:hypothetical protein OTSKATO_1416 [Orientia tsutsugamushi str. Kato PP]SPR07418.1 Uncharacterised protein [Orientia tsutsugamushi]